MAYLSLGAQHRGMGNTIYTVSLVEKLHGLSARKPWNATKIEFIPEDDGYRMLKHKDSYIYADNATQPTYNKVTRTAPGENKLGHWIVLKYFGKDTITISCKKWPDKFSNGVHYKYNVHLVDGNTDNGVQFYLDECYSEEGAKSGWKEYNCPDLTPPE